jgi:hypothetical protein
MKWELILQAVGLTVGAVLSIIQLRNLTPGSRSTLKTDLEILRLLEPSDANYPIVKAVVDRSVTRIYPALSQATKGTLKVTSWRNLYYGVFCVLVYVSWTLQNFSHGFSWWGVVTSFFVLVGFNMVINAFNERPPLP